MDSQDQKYMRRALTLAERSLGLSSPNPAVGCVIVRDDRIVGEGSHDYRTRDHAEVRALAKAGKLAAGATVYVTLEPCVHEGRTPPCTNALKAAGVRRIVIGHEDPNPRVSGKGIDLLREVGIEVGLGLFQSQAARVIEPFACHVTTGLPLVVAKAGMSLDGRIAAAGGAGGSITSPEGRKFGQNLRLQMDALMVGIGTVLADNPRLTYRGGRVKGRPLTRVVLDSMLRIPLDARFLRESPELPALIFCGHDAPDERRRQLESSGAEIVSVTRHTRGLDLNQVLRELGRRDILGVLVEGGSEIHWSFLSANLADKFYFIVAPVVLGGRGAVPAVGGPGYASVGDAQRFKIARKFRAGPDLVLEAYPSCSRSILSPWRRDASSGPCTAS